MLLVALAFEATVSIGGMQQKIAYQYKNMASADATILYDGSSQDYFISLYADGRIVAKQMLVYLNNKAGRLVGIAFRVGTTQFDSCNFTFATGRTQQAFYIAQFGNSVVLLNTHIYFDGETGINTKTIAFHMLNSTIKLGGIYYNTSYYLPQGGFLAQGPPCAYCRTGNISQQCVVCPHDYEPRDGECVCKYNNSVMENDQCVSSVVSDGFITAGYFGYIMTCYNNLMLTLGVTTTNSAYYVSTFLDDNCSLTNIIVKGYITYNMYVNTEIGGLTFRISKNVSYITSYLTITKYGNPSDRMGGIATTIDAYNIYEINHIFLYGSMIDECRADAAAFYGSYGGLVSYIAGYTTKIMNVTFSKIVVSGQTMRFTGSKNIGLVVGLIEAYFVKFTDILITSKTTAFYLEDLGVESVQIDQIDFPCKNIATAELLKSYKLSFIAYQFHATSNRAYITGSISNAGGLIGHYCGYYTNSEVTVDRVISDADAAGKSYDRAVNCWQNGVLIGAVNQTSHFTVNSAFAWGFVRSHCRGGAISLVQSSTTTVVFACSLEVATEYSSGPLGCVAEDSAVTQTTGINVYGYAHVDECGGMVGTLESRSRVTAKGCIGKMAFEPNAARWRRSKCAAMVRGGSNINGVSLEGDTVWWLDGNWVDDC